MMVMNDDDMMKLMIDDDEMMIMGYETSLLGLEVGEGCKGCLIGSILK
jgi:hypothetical protein